MSIQSLQRPNVSTIRMGLVVMDEIFDTWEKGKKTNDYHLIFADWHEKDWRAQLRRRNQAVERMGKPILGANIFALSIMSLFAIGFLATQATNGLRWLSWFTQLPQAPAFHLDSLWPSALLSSAWGLPLLIPVCATLALLGGVVVYLALEKQ